MIRTVNLRFSMNLLLLVVGVIFLLLESSDAVAVTEVYRMFQLEKAGVPLGSQRVGVNLLATSPLRSGSVSR
jgi:hypothetical protein